MVLGGLWPLDGSRLSAAVFLALGLAEAGFDMVRFGGSFWRISWRRAWHFFLSHVDLCGFLRGITGVGMKFLGAEEKS